jgi:hypothetical protein
MPAPVPRSGCHRLYTTAITCGVDGLAHEVTDENMAAGRHAGRYQALCGYRVLAAAMAAPIGRPCSRCTAVLEARQPTGTAWRPRHRRPGWLWRILHPGRSTRADARRRLC